MAFLKRLGFYLFGLSIGLVFLSIFLKKKSEQTGVYFCYLPNCRTLKDIRSKRLVYSDQISELLQNKQLDSLEIATFLNDGDVDFGNSDVSSKDCKIYFIEGELKGKEAILKVKNCTDKAIVDSIDYE